MSEQIGRAQASDLRIVLGCDMGVLYIEHGHYPCQSIVLAIAR
jgi:hypothetical protein